ncbi:MAG: hypothetical protein ACFB10_06750 [Salibacteraceae bacterium]
MPSLQFSRSMGRIHTSFMVVPTFIIVAVLFVLITGYFFSWVPLLLSGLFFKLTSTGVDFDCDRDRFRQYTNYGGLWKRGEWKPLPHYPYITVLHRKLKSKFNSQYVLSHDDDIVWKVCYDVCLLSKTHRHKVPAMRLKSEEEALKEARKLAKLLDKDLTKYAPKISEATAKKKRKSRLK